MSKISITSDNNTFFLGIVLFIFRVFNRKWREHWKLYYLAISNCDTSFKISNSRWVSFHFYFFTKMFDKWAFQLRTITSGHYIQHIILHQNLVCVAMTNLKYKYYNNFYQFFLLLSVDESLNPGPAQISPAVNVNI